MFNVRTEWCLTTLSGIRYTLHVCSYSLKGSNIFFSNKHFTEIYTENSKRFNSIGRINLDNLDKIH